MSGSWNGLPCSGQQQREPRPSRRASPSARATSATFMVRVEQSGCALVGVRSRLMACQGSLPRFLKPPLQGNDRHAQELSHPDRWDVSALRRRIGRIAAEVEIPSTRLWY